MGNGNFLSLIGKQNKNKSSQKKLKICEFDWR